MKKIIILGLLTILTLNAADTDQNKVSTAVNSSEDTSSINFKRGKTEKLNNNKELIWIETRLPNNSFFRLGNGFSKISREKINPMLDELQTKEFKNALECHQSVRESTDNQVEGEYIAESRLNYISSNFLGFEVFRSYFCGGPYPDHGTAYYVLNINTAEKYRLEDILPITKDAEKIRSLAFSGAELNPELQNSTYHMSCNPYELYHWEYLDWSLSKKGIRFYLSFATYERSCRGEYYEISFEKLKPYLSEKFLKKIDKNDAWVND